MNCRFIYFTFFDLSCTLQGVFPSSQVSYSKVELMLQMFVTFHSNVDHLARPVDQFQ